MTTDSSTRISRTRAWILATRPRTLTAAAAPVVAGCGFAVADGLFAQLPALAALVGALLIQIATNLANDYYDFFKGGDTGERLGPVRVTQAGILPPPAVFRGMVLTLVFATLCGVYLAAVAGWPVIVIGLVSMAMGVGYTGGPYPLAYHGLGDAFVFLFFGPVATAATYFVQAQTWSADALLAGIGLGFFSTAMLVVNNLRDRETDGAAGKRTLAVRFGDRFTVAQYFVCLAAAAAVPAVGVALLDWTPLTLVSLVALFPCLPAGQLMCRFAGGGGASGKAADRRAADARATDAQAAEARAAGARAADRRVLNPALGMTARGVAWYGAGLGVGAALGAMGVLGAL